jgi:16S rRNA (cytidine1402-2'-O)-methyltransferase
MALVYLIPVPLSDDAATTIPPAVSEAILQCDIFFTENVRTARRFFKKINSSIVIDNYEWAPFSNGDEQAKKLFSDKLKAGSTIGIVSEAGCPGIADPGQELVAIAQEKGVVVKPLVGPSSILLALMASGLNGQQFCFHGYLPIDSTERARKIKDLEAQSKRNGATQIFIETPYRNNQLLEAILQHALPSSRLCIAADLTAPSEFIATKTISDWKKEKPDLHKKPVIFCLRG